MDQVIAKNKKHLQELIDQQIAKYGNNADLGFIDTSQIKDMSFLFLGSQFNGDISKWNTGNVEYMACMFQCSMFNQDIGDWYIRSVKNIRFIFDNSQFNNNLYRWTKQKTHIELELDYYIPSEFLKCRFYDRFIDYDISG